MKWSSGIFGGHVELPEYKPPVWASEPMRQINETCSCGAQFTMSGTADEVQTGVESWRAGHQHKETA